ncbi:hypothetical protein ROJ8625_03954 [Roseivivax jejudonensis]|uniref:Uncharacterized protein n=1 Tax=Roseivivax jejudonensis TaxID=1529041 RepID=A0A1X7A9V0_9RHOB|nr:hypothetical protein [Roseivivax jejudonensis]SLN73577.1 hypothetical protein ROJ8625_03954 [Roseivivax jejudonensis]
MMEQTYFVTRTPEIDGVHFVHSDKCQVFPDMQTEELGTFEGCEAAMDVARGRYDPINACALCCPKCYVKRGDADAAA